MTPSHFEDFVPQLGKHDLFDKVEAFYHTLATEENVAPVGLGLRSLTGTHLNMTLRGSHGEEHEVLMLGSNSYLGLTRHPTVVAAAKAAIDTYGYGAGAVSLYTGATNLHQQLEASIADFYHTEDAILFPGGYATNVGVLSALCGPGDVIIMDAANHASLFDGARLSGATIKVYPHGSMAGLERILKRLSPEEKGRLIVTDGVFSMHGDLAPLDTIVDLAQRYHARLLVDDAHGIGIVGPTGRGTAERFGVMEDVDIHVAMLSKAPGGLGGVIAGSKQLINYLRFYARPYFFSTALPASVCAGLIEVFKLLKSDQAGRATLVNCVNTLKEALRTAGFTIGESQSAIIPVIIGDEPLLYRFEAALLQHGIYANTVTYPAVRRKECRLRICVMSALTDRTCTTIIEKMIAAAKEVGVPLSPSSTTPCPTPRPTQEEAQSVTQEASQSVTQSVAQDAVQGETPCAL